MNISIIIVNFNDWRTTKKYIENIRCYKKINHIIVVDNCSSDDSFYHLKKLTEIKKVDVIKSEKNGGYGYGNNFGIKYAIDNYISDIVLVSNPDVQFEEEILDTMIFQIEKKADIAIVAPLMRFPDGRIAKDTAWRLPKSKIYFFLFDTPFNCLLRKKYFYKTNEKGIIKVDAVAGSFFMMKTNDFEKIGGFDEDVFLYFEETVLGIKLRNIDKKIILIPNISFVHSHSVSISKSYRKSHQRIKLLWESKRTIFKKYYDVTKIDIFLFDVFKLPMMGISVLIKNIILVK